MKYIDYTTAAGVAHLTLNRGKVNALNLDVVKELDAALDSVEQSEACAVCLAGNEKFFCFGFDVPEMLPWPVETMRDYLLAFTALTTRLYLFPKPLLAKLAGHAIAGGCMLAIMCDQRVMVRSKARISLNEIAFGASVFAGVTEILRELIGTRHAGQVLLTGKFYDADEAAAIGLVDQAVDVDNIDSAVQTRLDSLMNTDATAYAALKQRIRAPIVKRFMEIETESIDEFLDIWYSPNTREALKKIQIKN